MAKQSKENYTLGSASDLQSLKMLLEPILIRIAQRLDTIQGLLPDLGAGLYDLATGKTLSTTEDVSGFGLGTMSTQDKDSVDIDGGLMDGVNISGQNITITITDATGEVIHKLS